MDQGKHELKLIKEYLTEEIRKSQEQLVKITGGMVGLTLALKRVEASILAIERIKANPPPKPTPSKRSGKTKVEKQS